jgi:hypothetical protein
MSKTTVQRGGLVFVIAAILAVTFGIGVGPALAAGHDTFDVSVYHGIDGQRLGLSRELPVDVYIFNNVGLIGLVSGFTYQERFEATLPAGEYTIQIWSQELQTFLPSMTVGPVDIPEGVEVRMNAQLGEGKTPVINVKIK